MNDTLSGPGASVLEADQGRKLGTGRQRLSGLRILIVLPSYALNGAERQAYLLARHLQSHEGAVVTFVSTGGTGGIERLCREAGLPCLFYDVRHGYRDRVAQVMDVLRFIRFLRRQRPDVLLPYCMFQNMLCALTWRLGGAGICIWGQRDEGRSRLERWVERIAVRQISCFVSNSQHGADFLIDTLQIDKPAVHVIPNGVETPAAAMSREGWRAKLGLSNDAFVAAMIATLHRFKDHPTLVAAWRLVVDQMRTEGKDAHLLLAGLWEDRYEELKAQVAALGLESHVHFLGEVVDVGGLLRSLDLFVFSSFTEGVPNAILEAMACEVAVVGTDYAGVREAVGEANRPLLAAPQNPESLAAKIVMAAWDPELRRRHARLGRQRIDETFSLEAMCEGTVQLIVNQRARR